MSRIKLSAFALLALGSTLFTTPALAGAPMNLDEVKATIARNLSSFDPRIQVKEVRQLDAVPGLYEVNIGNQILYTDVNGKHMIFGHIYDTTTRTDLTKARLEDINRVDWSSLPLENAIVSGDPKGKPVAVFTDPDCPFCRHLEKEMPKVKGVKVYTFLMPLESLHKFARGKAEAIWCSKDRHAALQAVMINDKKAADLEARDCKTPISANIALGESLGINGTPTLIAGDGRKHAGGFSAEQLEAWVNQ